MQILDLKPIELALWGWAGNKYSRIYSLMHAEPSETPVCVKTACAENQVIWNQLQLTSGLHLLYKSTKDRTTIVTHQEQEQNTSRQVELWKGWMYFAYD